MRVGATLGAAPIAAAGAALTVAEGAAPMAAIGAAPAAAIGAAPMAAVGAAPMAAVFLVAVAAETLARIERISAPISCDMDDETPAPSLFVGVDEVVLRRHMRHVHGCSFKAGQRVTDAHATCHHLSQTSH